MTDSGWLLSGHGRWPRHQGTSKTRDEVSPPHSVTSSMRLNKKNLPETVTEPLRTAFAIYSPNPICFASSDRARSRCIAASLVRTRPPVAPSRPRPSAAPCLPRLRAPGIVHYGQGVALTYTNIMHTVRCAELSLERLRNFRVKNFTVLIFVVRRAFSAEGLPTYSCCPQRGVSERQLASRSSNRSGTLTIIG